MTFPKDGTLVAFSWRCRDSLPAEASELLKWVALGSLSIGCLELVQKKITAARPRQCWTLLDLVFFILTLGAATCASVKGFFLICEKQTLAPRCPAIIREAFASFAVVIAFLGVAFISLHRQRKGLMPSGFVCVVLGILFTTSTADFLMSEEELLKNEIVVSDLYLQKHVVAINAVLAIAALGCFLASGLRDTPVYNSKSKKFEMSTSEGNRSPFGILIGLSIYKHIKNIIVISKTVYEDLPTLSQRLQCSLMLDRLYSLVTKTKSCDKYSRKRTQLLRAIYDIIWLDTFWVIIVQYAYCGCLIARVPVLENLIASNNQSEQSSLILLFVATITAESLISCYSVYLTMRLAIRIRSMLQAAIFRKITRLSPTSRSDNPPGYVVTVMGIDCMQLSMSLQQFPPPLVGLTCMPVVFYLLATRVGTGPALCCAAWLLITLTLPFPTSRLQNAIWRRIMKCRDDRLKRFTDLLSSVRLVKMYAWEDAYMKAVKELRDKEMVPVFLVNLVDGLIDSLYSASSSVMVIILFGTLAVLDPTRTLSASLAFSCVYTLSLAEIPTNGITQLLRMRSMTRILVSNQGHILKHMDQLLLMHGKTVITHRSIADLVQDDRAPETLRLGANMPPSQMTVDASLQHLKSKRDMARGRVIRKEASSSSMGTLEVVWSLCKLSGFCVPIGTAFFIASAVALAWQQLWIKQWTDANSEDSTVDPHSPSWVKGLVALCLSDVLFRSVGGILFALSNRRLSMGLHNSMLSHVMHSPVPFFDSTPRARLLNRFTVDLESIDCRLYLAGKLGTQNILITLSRLSIIGSQTPPVLGVGVVAVILMAIGMVITVRASNSIRFKESTHVSKVLQHTTETIESLSTIRAYGAVERFCKHFCRLTDGNMRMTYGFMGCFRLTKVLTSLLGFVIVLATLISAALLPAEEDGVSKSSSVGLALSSSLAIPMSLMSLCMVVFNLFQLIVCFERCIEYTKLPKEEQVEKPKKDGDTKRVNDGSRAAVALSANESWPTEGRVEFKDYSTSYRPGVLPDVLKGVTFYVDAYEKVGVVGRTGAGKSSLVLALLRVLKATEGCIKIDGVDISQVPLRRLRSAVTVIPQDPILVRGSLRDNLDPTRSHTDEELWRALNQAHLGDLVTRHPEQLLLQTGDGGSNLSVGQRQLVCLARALIRMPRVLILDEATSQMDGDTDRLIQATLRESFVRCTVLAIAHRIHTVLDYDKILVMSDGSVLEYGSVTQLLSNPATMFRSMAQSAGVVPSLDSEQKKISRTKL
ncbi:ATP-binding cassette sub-family C member 3 [Ixodes scapularis]